MERRKKMLGGDFVGWCFFLGHRVMGAGRGLTLLQWTRPGSRSGACTPGAGWGGR